MEAKGPLSRKLTKTLSKFTNYSPQCIIMQTSISLSMIVTQGLLLTAAGPFCIPTDYVQY